MTWLIQRLRVPASECQMGVVLAFSSVVMSLLFWVIMWQFTVIANQRDVIHWLAHGIGFGG